MQSEMWVMGRPTSFGNSGFRGFAKGIGMLVQPSPRPRPEALVWSAVELKLTKIKHLFTPQTPP